MMEKTFFSPLRAFLSAVFDLIFPPVCLHCSRRIKKQQNYLCESCELEIILVSEPQCPICGYTLQSETCSYCEEHILSYDRAVSLYEYAGPVRTLVHYMKFGDMPGIAGYLSKKMVSFLIEKKLFLDTTMITAIPLHSVRERQRGYNQAGLMAEDLSKGMNWHFKRDIIRRIRATIPQANLIRAKRLMNVDRAFQIKKMVDLKLENILLLDDVYTTGATIQAACHELNKAHPGKIYVLTIGRA